MLEQSDFYHRNAEGLRKRLYQAPLEVHGEGEAPNRRLRESFSKRQWTPRDPSHILCYWKTTLLHLGRMEIYDLKSKTEHLWNEEPQKEWRMGNTAAKTRDLLTYAPGRLGCSCLLLLLSPQDTDGRVATYKAGIWIDFSGAYEQVMIKI